MSIHGDDEEPGSGRTAGVLLAGTGGGGLLAWAAALRHPDRFAALVIRNSRLDEVTRLYLPVANNLPIYQLVSERAPPDIIGSLRESEGALSRWHYTARHEEIPGHRHPAMPELNDKVHLCNKATGESLARRY